MPPQALNAIAQMNMMRNRDLQAGVDLDKCMNEPLAQIPANYYNITDYDGEQAEAEFEDEFGAIINFLSSTGGKPNKGVATSLIQANTIPSPFLMAAAGVYIVVEPYAFGDVGAGITPPSSVVDTPAFNGVVPFGGLTVGGQVDAKSRPAIWEHGGPIWRAMWAFCQAYRLRFTLLGKFQLFDELIADLGVIDSDNAWEGFSSSNIPPQQRLRDLNDHARLIQKGSIFIDQNVSGTGESIEAIAPNLLPASWGSPKLCGVYGGYYPTKRLLVLPGVPLQMQAERDTDTEFFTRLQAELTAPGAILPDEFLSEVIAGNLGYSSVIRFLSGMFRIGLVMKGYDLTPLCCVNWYMNYAGMCGPMYSKESTCLSALNGLAQAAGLKGLPPMISMHDQVFKPLLAGFSPDLIGDPKLLMDSANSLEVSRP